MSEWMPKTLGELLGEKGYIRGPFGSSLKRGEMKENGIPVYEQLHAIYNTREFRFYIDEKKFKELERFQVKTADLIISCSGTVGKISIIEDDDPKGIISQALLILRPEIKNVRPVYLKYFLTSELGQYHLLSASHGSVQPNIAERKIVQQIPIDLPAVDEQDKIIEVLSSLDDKIDLLHRNNKTLEQLAETLFRQWFLEEAEDSTVEEEFNVTMGQSPPGDSYNENANGIIFYQGRTDFKFRIPIPRIYCTKPTRYAEKFDTLLSVRAPVGDINLANCKCCIGRGVAAIRHKNNKIHYSYTYNKFKQLRDIFNVHEDTGTVFGSINKEDLLAVKCTKLDIEKIDLYNREIGTLDDKIFSNCHQIQQLETLRDTLLPKLMSGVLRVEN